MINCCELSLVHLALVVLETQNLGTLQSVELKTRNTSI